MLDIDKIKNIIETTSMRDIIMYAQKTYPNECCGFVLEDGLVHPAHNVIESLYDKALNSKNAFLIDDASWQSANQRDSKIMAIYHSHINGDANASASDRVFFKWPDIFYLVIGILDTSPIAANLYWWEEKSLRVISLNI